MSGLPRWMSSFLLLLVAAAFVADSCTAFSTSEAGTIARTFANARAQHLKVSKQDVHVPRLDDAYLVQSEMVLHHVDTLGEVVGWKVGASNNPAMAKLGIDEPFRGPLFKKHVHRGSFETMWNELGSGLVAFECELCFTMASALPEKDGAYSEEEVLSAVGSVCPAIEIAAVRADDALPFSPSTLGTCVADSALNGVCVLGEQILPAEWDSKMLEKVAAKLSARALGGASEDGGELVEVEGDSSRVLGTPIKSLTWLVNHLISKGTFLEKGHIVMTGAATLLAPPKVSYGTPYALTAQVWMRGRSKAPSEVQLTLR